MQNPQPPRMEACTHNVYIKGLCGNCGIRLDPPQSNSVSMIHSVPELKVTEEYAKEIGKDDQERLIQAKKLVLLVDLDQTILHTTHEPVRDPNVYSFQLWPGHPTYYTKLRPYLKQFLEEMSKIYELHIFTFGCRMYAHKIASLIDPQQKYFGNRILSRDESVDPNSKRGNLSNLFPRGDAMVCIIDDRSDVWHNAGNLIQVKPYSYFKTSISDGLDRNTSYQTPILDEEELSRDADELSALLGVDNCADDESTNGTATDASESSHSAESANNATEMAYRGESRPEIETGDSQNSGKKPTELSGREENKEQEPEQARPEKRPRLDSTTMSDSDKQPEGPASEVTKCDQDKQVETKQEELEQGENKREASASLEKAHPSTSSLPGDFDDHLLKIQSILSRVHEKWYMELDEQRQFLEDGESYKLPDIKDIISRYLRKSYR